MEETVGELTRQAVLDCCANARTHALLTMAMGEVVETVTGNDPLADLRARLRQWSRDSTVGRELLGAVTAACQDHSTRLQILSVWVSALLAQPINPSNN